MDTTRLEQITKRIAQIKEELQKIGPMRPGSLTRQYRDPENRVGSYWQVSYTHQMKSRTDYVRKEWVAEIRQQIATHKKFKHLIEEWTELSIEHSKLSMQLAKTAGKE